MASLLRAPNADRRRQDDGYAAWSDAGGLAMGYYDYSRSSLYALAKEFVLADEFFQGAFGGSFLNHQYLICACAPEYPNADTAAAAPSIALLEQDSGGRYLPRLKTATTPPASALDEPPTFARSGNIAPANYFGDGKFYAVNTMQPPYQPSGNKPGPPIQVSPMRIPTTRRPCRRKHAAISAMHWTPSASAGLGMPLVERGRR